MIFASDNWSGASEQVIGALAAAARRGGPAYGGDDLTKAVEQRFAALFDHEVTVFLVPSGTAANTLAVSAFARPGGIVFAHEEAHIRVDEAGATEFFGSGLRILPLKGETGKLEPEALAEGLARYPEETRPHLGQPALVSISQSTELGAVYAPDDVAALAKVAKSRGLPLHMDGARFANAVAALGVHPADLTWRAGVDVLSFGGTKNGCVAAEAVIFFNRDHARDVPFARQRAGHGLSKIGFMAAQFEAYLAEGHWLDLARQANASAARLADALRKAPGARLAVEPGANEIFAVLAKTLDEKLKAAGAVYYPWDESAFAEASRPTADEVLVRLVTSWQTTADEVDRFAALLG